MTSRASAPLFPSQQRFRAEAGNARNVHGAVSTAATTAFSRHGRDATSDRAAGAVGVKLRGLLAAGLVSLALTPPSQAQAEAPDEGGIRRVIAGEHRSPENRARDLYRHPLETLTFFGVAPDMTVVEIWPGGAGWYTEILAPLLRDSGKLYAAHFSPDSDVEYFRKGLAQFKAELAEHPDLYDDVVLTVLQPPHHLDIAPEASADRVLTFRNVHNWMRNGQAPAVFQAMFRALKPGGILGVVEHRNPAGTRQDSKAASGYVTEESVIRFAQEAGFKLLDRSEINANPADTHDHPEGVWTLPPSLRLKDRDREKYLAIGESDRMTLKFIKP